MSSEVEEWVVGRRIATYCTYLGIQDSTQNRRLPSKTPGTWAGAMITYQHNYLLTCVDKLKWGETRKHLEWMSEEEQKGEVLKHKKSEQAQGFLVYVSRKYPYMTTYLKGINLALDQWR